MMLGHRAWRWVTVPGARSELLHTRACAHTPSLGFPTGECAHVQESSASSQR